MTIVELHVPNFETAKNYYEKLGFIVVWERKPEGFKGYLIMKMGENILTFWGGNEVIYRQPHFKQFPKETPRGYGVEIILMVEDVEAYYRQVKDGAEVVEDLTLQPWGLKDFRIKDPFGFYLRITEKHDITDPRYAVK